MSLKPWSELTVAERRKFSVQARRNPRKAYEKIVPETPSTPEEPVVETVDIAVSVTDGADPVSGVTVAIGEITGTTGGAGGCTLADVPFGAATVTATAIKEGFEEYSDDIVVTIETTTLSIELTAIVADET